MTVAAFAYAKVVVSDSDALKPFYTDALGLAAPMLVEEGEGAGGKTTVPAFDIPEHKMRMAYAADPEGHTIELMTVG